MPLIRRRSSLSAIGSISRLVAIATFVLFAAGFATAQTFNTGEFLGTVTDASGAAVPGATVRAIRVDQPLIREAVTDLDGSYRIERESSGRYRFEFEKAGFQKVARSEMELGAGQSLRVDATLPVGSITDTVQVTAAAAQVDTATANVGSRSRERRCRNWPSTRAASRNS
jgi:hypothetical protein